jgi:hypothetical protein
MRYVQSRDKRLGETMIRQAHVIASMTAAASVGKLEPIDRFLPKEDTAHEDLPETM